MGDALETLGLTQGLPIAGLPLLAGLTSVEAYNAMTWIMARGQRPALRRESSQFGTRKRDNASFSLQECC